MNYKRLEDSILKPCSILTKGKGRELFINNSVKSIQGKKVEAIYHIYGQIDDNSKSISTHIKYNLKSEKVCGIKCTCSKHKEYLEQGYTYYCEHIAATAFKFLASLKVKAKNTTQNNENIKVEKDKEILYIDTKLYYQKVNDINKFIVELKIGNKVKYQINNIKSFIYAAFNNKEIQLTNTFKYDPRKYNINRDDLKYLEFIKDNIINNENYSGNKLNISQKKLPVFLNEIPNGELTFKDMYLEYKTVINKDILNLAFNLREENDVFVLSSEKNLPIPLDNKNRVYLFNREIYILSKEVAQNFKPLYNDLKKNNFKYFPGNNENFIKIISIISSISNKVNISDDLRNYLRRFIKGRYFINRDENGIYCDIKVIYGDKKINFLNDNKLKLGWIRDLKYEERLLMTFERYGFIKDKSRMKFIGDDEKLYLFLTSKENDILSYGEIIIPETLNEFKVYNSKDLYGTVYEEDWAIKLSYGIKGISDDEFKKAYYEYKLNKSFYKSKNNSYIDLTDNSVRDLFNMINLLNLEKDLDKGMSYIHKGKASLVSEMINKCDLSFIYSKDKLVSIEEKLDYLNKNKLDLSNDLIRLLRPYQYDGVEWIRNLYKLDFSGILADEMGLGKTLQTISFISMEQSKKGIIIVPTSLIYNWRDEFFKFAPEIKVGIVYGDAEKREEIINDENYNVLITTYGILKNDLSSYENKEFDYCIIDEAQNIKNYKSQNAKVVKSIKAKFKLALTGTPLENNIKELWSIFDFIMPGFLYSINEFESKFNKDDDNSLLLLKSLVNPFILRRTKAEVAKDLPRKSESRMSVILEESQKLIYKSYINNIKEKIRSNSNVQVFSYLTRLRQICLHPSLVFPEYIGDSGKFKVAHSLIERSLKEDRKILVFSQFTSVLDLFGKELEDKDIKYYTLSGSTSSKDRVSLVNNFNEKEEVKVFLISLKAGGTGLNLTSANLVIHFDPWWNPAVEAQASDRAHRIGQRKEVEVIKLVAKDTIEEKIISLQDDKKELIEDILCGNNISNTTINKKSIEELVKNYICN